MAMSGMGMMAGMAAGQALVSALMGGGSGAAGGMMGSFMPGMGMRGGRGMSRQGRRAAGSGPVGMEMPKPADIPGLPAGAQQAVPFALVSKLPGRRRYRTLGLTAELAQLLQEKLQQLSFLQEVQVNAATGSLLFLFPQDEQAEEQMDKLAAFLQGRIFRPLPRPVPVADLSLEAHAGLLTRSIRGTVRDFSAWIKSHTGGWLDVSSAASIFFLCKGLQQMLASQQLPSGSQMFWWAVSLMRGWQTV